MAEPRITEACIALLEDVSGKPRQEYKLTRGSASDAIAASKPVAWWRLNEFAGPTAFDSSGNGRDAFYEPDVTFYLEGPHSDGFCLAGETNRAPMFVGGRLQTRISRLNDEYSVSMWIWNGMPIEGREVSGWFLSRGRDNGLSRWSEHLGVGGTSGHSGKLIFFAGNDPSTVVAGKTPIPRWKWQHIAFVRNRRSVTIYLNAEKEIEADTEAGSPANFTRIFAGGRSDNNSNWEGRLDEVAIFDRALTPEEVSKLAR
jgi:hypothetical protein